MVRVLCALGVIAVVIAGLGAGCDFIDGPGNPPKMPRMLGTEGGV